MFTDKVTALKVKILNEVGEAKQSTEFEMKEATEIERVLITQNIFAVMGIENNMSQMIDDYAKIGKAYQSFFSEVEPIENDPSQPKRILPLRYTDKEFDKNSIAGKLEEKLKDLEKMPKYSKYSRHTLSKEYDSAIKRAETVTEATESTNTEISTSDAPAHYKTGIKEDPKGNKYQCRLICESTGCGKQQTVYILKEETSVYCKECGKTHKVRRAKAGYMAQDSRNNFFIAGKFIGADENKTY